MYLLMKRRLKDIENKNGYERGRERGKLEVLD